MTNCLLSFLSVPCSDMKLGRNVARTFLDFYKLVGYISAKPSSSITPKTSRHSDPSDVGRGDHEENRYNFNIYGGDH